MKWRYLRFFRVETDVRTGLFVVLRYRRVARAAARCHVAVMRLVRRKIINSLLKSGGTPHPPPAKIWVVDFSRCLSSSLQSSNGDWSTGEY